jgi:hypothetical protein
MRLNVKFPPPGFLLNDPRVVVGVDGRTLYDGSFRDGFDVSVEVQPGTHVLETAIHGGGSVERQRFELALDERNYRDVPIVDAKLSYSRLAGCFDKRVSLSARR